MVNVIGFLLMVASNAISWLMVAASSSASLSVLRSAVWKISLFYTLWALYNRFPGGQDKELGYISMGLLTLSCLATQYGGNHHSSLATKAPLLVSCGLVLANFAVVVPMIVKAKGPAGFAKKVYFGDTSTMAVVWGYTFTAYILSNIAMWSFVGYRFYQLPVGDENAAGYAGIDADTTIPSIEEGDFQPVLSSDL